MLSGRLPVAIRLPLLSAAWASVLTAPDHLLVHTARISRKPHATPAPPRHSHHTRRAPHTHHTYHTSTTHDITPPNPRTLHTHHIHTTPHLLTTRSHPHHSHHSHHHTRSCPRKLEMAFSLSVPRGCTLCLIKSTQYIQSCIILPKLNKVKQNLTHANTLTNTLTKTRTNTWPTDTPVTTCTFSYTPVHTNTPNLHHKYTHECTDKKRPQILTAELLCPCYHVTW